MISHRPPHEHGVCILPTCCLTTRAVPMMYIRQWSQVGRPARNQRHPTLPARSVGQTVLAGLKNGFHHCIESEETSHGLHAPCKHGAGMFCITLRSLKLHSSSGSRMSWLALGGIKRIVVSQPACHVLRPWAEGTNIIIAGHSSCSHRGPRLQPLLQSIPGSIAY